MGDWTTIGEYTRCESFGADLSNSRGTNIVSGSLNGKGSYVELLASTSFDTNWITLYSQHDSTTNMLIDLAVGAAASEQIILSNLGSHSKTGGRAADNAYVFPLKIPAGSRLSARCQADGTNVDAFICGQFYGQGTLPFSGLGRVTTYGANVSTSLGTVIDPGGTADTKGSWVQITAATTNPIRCLHYYLGNNSNFALANIFALLDIGVGAAASEVVVGPNIPLGANSNTDTYKNSCGFIPCSIPAGSRLAARAQSSSTDATDRLFDLILYGVD